jgi:hypothetical protein
MRIASVVVIVLAACGGSTPPPESPSSDTSSLEAKGSSSAEAPAESPSPAASAAPAAAAAAPSPSSDSTAAAPASGAFHPAPSVTGMVDGQAFAPKVAQVVGPMKKDGRVLIALSESSDCPTAGGAKDDATLTMLVPWQDGYKIDLSALKRSAKKGPAEIAFNRGKKASASFKPSGTVTIVSAPMAKGATGKMKIDLQSGDYMLAGDLDIQICVAPK